MLGTDCGERCSHIFQSKKNEHCFSRICELCRLRCRKGLLLRGAPFDPCERGHAARPAHILHLGVKSCVSKAGVRGGFELVVGVDAFDRAFRHCLCVDDVTRVIVHCAVDGHEVPIPRLAEDPVGMTRLAASAVGLLPMRAVQTTDRHVEALQGSGEVVLHRLASDIYAPTRSRTIASRCIDWRRRRHSPTKISTDPRFGRPPPRWSDLEWTRHSCWRLRTRSAYDRSYLGRSTRLV